MKLPKNSNNYNNSSYESLNPPFFPSEKGYHTVYDKAYLTKLKNSEKFELKIEHLSNKIKDDYNNYLTVRKNNKNTNLFLTLNNRNSINLKKCKSKEEFKEEDILLHRIFPDNKELNKFSNLPIFPLTKKKVNFDENEKINKRLLNEDFIYKISHGDRFFTNNDSNNFIRNKSIKKGLTINYRENKNKLSLPDIQLELNINNLKNKSEKISNKKKYFLVLQKKLNDLKNGKIFKQLEEDINNFKEDEELPKKNIDKKAKNEKEIKKENDLNKTNKIEKVKNLKKVKSYVENPIFNNKYYNELFDNNDKSNYFLKKPLKYPIHFYTNKQLEMKKKRYEKTHKEGWKEFKRKINIRNLGYNSYKNIKNPIILCVLEPNRDLQKKKIMTNKMVYLHECKIRDILISKKLKNEFSKDDIKRILNGQKPWKDFDINNKDNINEKKENSQKELI